ncbi:MAG: hypothetical protein HYZ54_12705 [Ignavibacteriae bacterium]|nr:hypothetical protein [Ignavibacteriota bacterium]
MIFVNSRNGNLSTDESVVYKYVLSNWEFPQKEYFQVEERNEEGNWVIINKKNEWLPPIHAISNISNTELLWEYWARAKAYYDEVKYALDFVLPDSKIKALALINEIVDSLTDYSKEYKRIDSSLFVNTCIGAINCYEYYWGYLKSLASDIQASTLGKNIPILPEYVNYTFDENLPASHIDPGNIDELKPVDQWDNSLKAMVLYKLFPDETGYSLANKYYSILKIKQATLRRLIQRAYPNSMEPLKEIDINIDLAKDAMRMFIESKNR